MNERRLPLVDVRVLECGDTLAAAYAGRLLVDLGADVVKVEDRGGDPLRTLGPFVGDAPHVELSASFAYFNAGKRSLHVDATSDAGRRVVAEWAAGADIVLRSTRAGVDWIADDDLVRLEQAHPGLVTADLTTLGRHGRVGPHPMDDLLALAAGGLLSVNSTDMGDPDGVPLRYRGELACVHTACDAVAAVLAALFERRRSGVGQRIDVSGEAAVAGILATALPTFSYTGLVAAHDGRRGVAPWGFYACRDGNVLIQCTEDQQWQAMRKMLGDPDWSALEIFDTIAQRVEAFDVLNPLVAEAVAPFTVDELLAAAHEHGLAAARINTARDLVEWEHLRARQFLETLTVSDGQRVSGDVLVPGSPWRYHGTPAVPRGPAPRLGSVGGSSAWPARTAPAAVAAAVNDPPPAPLAGVRVIDFTWVWAGPYASMQLAHFGADVIKIESSVRLDVTRRLGPFADDIVGVNRSGYFNQYNQGKRSVVLDPKDPRGLAVVKRLLADADVVIDNRRAGALARMGLSYDALRAINPRIVAVSMTGFGETGPERDRMAYGSIIDALSGVASANGPVGGGPTDFTMSLPDPAAGILAAIATLAAVYRARETGVGERVECNMLEASVAAFPWPVLFQSVTGHAPPVVGNRDAERSPHGVFPCQGVYQWVAISVRDDNEFAALARLMDSPSLATDARFATLTARRVHEDALEEILSQWTADQDAFAVAERLRQGGVPAHAVAHINDVFASPTLTAREFLLRLPHDEVGARPLAGVAWRTSRSPMQVTTAAPLLGADTRSVLSTLAGLEESEIDALAADGVLH
jgi:crotonobetainyl-CoA:carnitine CoA-transferase CaiB-like acyl-CoA transferase